MFEKIYKGETIIKYLDNIPAYAIRLTPRFFGRILFIR